MDEFEPDAKPFCDLKELKRLTEAWRVAQVAAEQAEAAHVAAQNELAVNQHEARQCLARLRCHMQAMDCERSYWAIRLDDSSVAVVPLSASNPAKILPLV